VRERRNSKHKTIPQGCTRIIGGRTRKQTDRRTDRQTETQAVDQESSDKKAKERTKGIDAERGQQMWTEKRANNIRIEANLEQRTHKQKRRDADPTEEGTKQQPEQEMLAELKERKTWKKEKKTNKGVGRGECKKIN
jgi:hypothetical protein